MAKKNLQCIVCECALHKYEAEFVDETTFAFYSKLPNDVQIGVYCGHCFDTKVKTDLDAYNEKMERAKNINMFYKSQAKESRFVRRTEKPVRIKDCRDRDETILRLAFLAAEAGKNALVDVDLSSIKVQDGRWQHSLWSGQGIPANIEESQLKRKFLDSCSYNS